jgi:hypothetical protein
MQSLPSVNNTASLYSDMLFSSNPRAQLVPGPGWAAEREASQAARSFCDEYGRRSLPFHGLPTLPLDSVRSCGDPAPA